MFTSLLGCSVTSLARERLFRQPMNSYSTEMNGHGCQTADGKCTAGVMETTAGHQMRVDTAASPSSSKTGSPSSSQVSNCLRPTPTNALKTQYTTSPCRGTCSRRLVKKLDMFSFSSLRAIRCLADVNIFL